MLLKERIASEWPVNLPGELIDYPVEAKVIFTIKSRNGFTRSSLVKHITGLYHQLYQEEEAFATVKTIPVNERQGVHNRNPTNGKYQIWGHDLGDLVLSGVNVYRYPEGRLVLLLDISS